MASPNYLIPGKANWDNPKEVYYKTKEWMRFIANGNEPVGTEYWNVADIYYNIGYESWWNKFWNGGIQGRTSREHYYPKAGLRIYVAETNLYKNYRTNYIQGIIPNDKYMTICARSRRRCRTNFPVSGLPNRSIASWHYSRHNTHRSPQPEVVT